MALQAGEVSAEHVLNTLSRLKEPCTVVGQGGHTSLKIQVPLWANTSCYDSLLRDGEVMA